MYKIVLSLVISSLFTPLLWSMTSSLSFAEVRNSDGQPPGIWNEALTDFSLKNSSEAVMTSSLRSLVPSQHFLIGSAVNLRALNEDSLYREALVREFNGIVAENEMKFKYLQPKPHHFDFTKADYLVEFAAANQMQFRGHTLVWHYALPDWLKEGNWTRDEAIAILEKHIKTVVGHYQGKVVAWDVVNEAIADDGTLRNSFWLQKIGPEYIEMAFQWAHEADPDTLLLYNDYGGEDLSRKSDEIYRLVQSLVSKNVPIHGVGLQMHIAMDAPPNPQDVASNMSRLGALGLQVHITEMDVRVKQPTTPQDLEKQAEIYRSMLETCISVESCNTFVTWGLSDRYSWIPSHFEGWGDALLFDERFQPKPAYQALIETLQDVRR